MMGEVMHGVTSIRFVTVLCTARLEQIKQVIVVRGTEVVYGVRSYWMWPTGDVGRKQADFEDLMHLRTGLVVDSLINLSRHQGAM